MATLLVVEDHPMFADALCRLLRVRGNHDVSLSCTAEDALRAVQHSPVDLVIIDISLPGRNGMWLLKALKRFHPHVRCLMLSGHLSCDYADESVKAGARGYVVKDDLPGIFEGIQKALIGETYVSEAVSRQCCSSGA